MTHPNRSQTRPRRNPRPAEIVAARAAAGLTQAQAAALVYADIRSWQKWEGAERSMHPAFWELFRRRAGALPAADR